MNSTRGRHRAAAPNRRRLSAGLVLIGLGTVAAGALGIASAQASAPPGSNFGAVDITARAGAIRVPFYSHAGEDVENEDPLALSTLESGGVGHALTSIFWPGDTGGHGGDTLYLLGSPCIPPDPQGIIPGLPCPTHAPSLPPGDYQKFNDPYKAESQTGAGKPTNTTTGPGTVMKATATPTNVTAGTSVDGSAIPSVGSTFGTSAAHTAVRVTGPNTAVVDAFSTVHDVKLGGGAISISSVTSVAHAVTNGTTARGTATTTVHGMTIAGVPVTVDDKGLHVAGKGSSLPGTAQLNSALKQSGFQVFVAQPSKKIQGAGVIVDSGSLIIMQNNPSYRSNANDTGEMLQFGGASIDASTGLGFPYTPLPPISAPAAGGGSVPPPTTTNVPPASTGSLPTGGAGAPPQVAPGTPTGQAPVLAAQKAPLPGGLQPGWVVAVVLGSGLIAFGLRRLPDRVLAAGGPACQLGES